MIDMAIIGYEIAEDLVLDQQKIKSFNLAQREWMRHVVEASFAGEHVFKGNVWMKCGNRKFGPLYPLISRHIC